MLPIFLNANMEQAFAGGFCGLWVVLYVMLWLGIVTMSIGLFVFKILMIIDCARKRFANSNEMVVWILVIMLVPYGSLIYYFAVKRPDPESPGLAPRKAQVS